MQSRCGYDDKGILMAEVFSNVQKIVEGMNCIIVNWNLEKSYNVQAVKKLLAFDR